MTQIPFWSMGHVARPEALLRPAVKPLVPFHSGETLTPAIARRPRIGKGGVLPYLASKDGRFGAVVQPVSGLTLRALAVTVKRGRSPEAPVRADVPVREDEPVPVAKVQHNHVMALLTTADAHMFEPRESELVLLEAALVQRKVAGAFRPERPKMLPERQQGLSLAQRNGDGGAPRAPKDWAPARVLPTARSKMMATSATAQAKRGARSRRTPKE